MERLSVYKWIKIAYSSCSTVLNLVVVLFIYLCVGDEQTRGGDSSFPESCRTADSDSNWGPAVTVGNGFLQNTDPWVFSCLNAVIHVGIDELLWLSEQWCDVWLVGDYDGALAVLSEMQHMCQERGLQLPGTNTPVGMNIMNFHNIIQSILVLKSTRVRFGGLKSGIFTRFCCLFGFTDHTLQSHIYKQQSCYVLWLISMLVKDVFFSCRVSSLLVYVDIS